MTFDYSSMDNHHSLVIVSNMWINHYNLLLNLPFREDWEEFVLENQIKTEKVFDI